MSWVKEEIIDECCMFLFQIKRITEQHTVWVTQVGPTTRGAGVYVSLSTKGTAWPVGVTYLEKKNPICDSTLFQKPFLAINVNSELLNTGIFIRNN